MLPHILAAPLPSIGAGLSIAAGTFIAGTLLLRWYRMKQEFGLLRVAIEKGIAPLPPSQPQWLISLRQGVMIITLGIGVAAAGWVGWKMARDVPRPPAVSEARTELPEPPLPPEPERGGREGRPRPPAPRPPDPAFDAWRRAQDQIPVCMALAGGGAILILLGLVRVSFVPAERRFAAQLSNMASGAGPKTRNMEI